MKNVTTISLYVSTLNYSHKCYRVKKRQNFVYKHAGDDIFIQLFRRVGPNS